MWSIFKALAQEVADTLGVTADQVKDQAARYTSELTAIKAAIAQDASSPQAARKQRLAFVVPGYARRGAVVGTASKRMKKLTSALGGYSAKTAVLWRFSSAGVAKHDSLQGGSAADGNHAVHVRGTASLASIEVMSRSEFENFSSDAQYNQRQAKEWKAALDAHQKKDQVGTNRDHDQEVLVGEALDDEPPKFCTGCGTPATGSKFCQSCGTKIG